MFLCSRSRGLLKDIDNVVIQSLVIESIIIWSPRIRSLQVEMELAPTNKHRMTFNTKTHTCTAAYAIDRGVTLSFRWSLDATLRRTKLLSDEVCRDFVGGLFSASSSSSTISFAEAGDVNMLL